MLFHLVLRVLSLRIKNKLKLVSVTNVERLKIFPEGYKIFSLGLRLAVSGSV
jgi:hypothetical protein